MKRKEPKQLTCFGSFLFYLSCIMDQDLHITANKEHWDIVSPHHLTSSFYDQASFLEGRDTLQSIEVNLLGDIRDLHIAHLQCHFGQDSISLARRGAQVTGIDFSSSAIRIARDTAEQLDLTVRFVESGIDDIVLLSELESSFDIVFASYGIIGWHPKMTNWMKSAFYLLKPGGRLLLVDFHPVLWMWNKKFDSIDYSYFNIEAFVEPLNGSYACENVPDHTIITYNHSIADILQSTLNGGFAITGFHEYDYSPYDCFESTVSVDGGFQIKGYENKLPMVFALEAQKS